MLLEYSKQRLSKLMNDENYEKNGLRAKGCRGLNEY